MSSLNCLTQEIDHYANREQALVSQRFFKTGLGEYGAGDIFLGLRVSRQRLISKKYLDLNSLEIAKLLNSKIHEFRFIALLILIEQYRQAPQLKSKKIIVDFYLKNIALVNNWDLVDLSAPQILGDFLWEKTKRQEKGKQNISHSSAVKLLNKLVLAPKLWERRIAMLATYTFLKNGQGTPTVIIAKKLLNDEEDLIHKAVGWMLRELGKNIGENKLLKFLDKNYKQMSRTTLRYAIERLSDAKRKYYLSKK